MLEIEATSSTPRIGYEDETHTLSISGESYPENSFEFYAPVFEWLTKTLESAPLFRLSLKVSYMSFGKRATLRAFAGHGGGEGRGKGYKQPVTPWGQPCKGYKTRDGHKPSSRFIVKRRK